ncbi:hypothetical protein PVK06_007336 [Gossypium arboreum]|uniref:Uncharacterized protein n=1 Tax=Gossypium arboreum TaxID=29729 RepID=A0ABR0QH13_GOSAR|nr:hypothetical protein PVK06_007336 [Gossypium arboreum]
MKRSKLFTISKEEEAEPKSKALKLVSVMLNFVNVKRDRKQKELIFVDINTESRRRSALIDTEASNLFIPNKFVGKLGLSVSKSVSGKAKKTSR